MLEVQWDWSSGDLISDFDWNIHLEISICSHFSLNSLGPFTRALFCFSVYTIVWTFSFPLHNLHLKSPKKTDTYQMLSYSLFSLAWFPTPNLVLSFSCWLFQVSDKAIFLVNTIWDWNWGNIFSLSSQITYLLITLYFFAYCLACLFTTTTKLHCLWQKVLLSYV